MRLYNKIIAKSSLTLAWNKVHSNQGAPGGNRQTLEDFAQNLERNLGKLHESLATGTYRPGPIRNITIPKRDGTPRPLSIPSVADRVVHTALCQGLTPILEPEMEDSSFAYRAGRSVQMAVDRIGRYFRQGYHWVVDGDIDDYFDSIPHHRLLEILRRYVDDEEVLELIARWLGHAHAGGVGISQGSPLSPLLANIYLDDIDERISRAGVRLVRFADDFVLLCKSPRRAREALTEMAALLAEYGLSLHPEKTRIVSFEQGFQFLGRLFVRSMVLEHDRSLDTLQERGPLEAPASCPEALGPGEQKFPVEPLHQEPEGPGYDDLSPRVRVMYLTRKGCCLDVRNRAFSVRSGPERGAPELIAVLPRRLDRVELWPGCDISGRAQRYALDCRVQVAYVDGWGRTLGILEPTAPDKAALHLAQAAIALDEAKRLNLAGRICTGRVRNQRALLKRLNRRRKDPNIEGHIAGVIAVLKRITKATTVQELLGFEGEAAKSYWAALALLVDEAWGFVSRVRRPPGDAVNMVISYTASMLYRDLHCLISRHGLHPGWGSLHGSLDGKPGCVSDLIEEFRAPLCEGLAVYLANNHILKKEMFYRTEKRPCQATHNGRETIIRSFEAWLDRPVKSPRSGDKVRWRGLLEEQVLAYRDHVLGQAPYEPYDMKY